MKWPHCYPLMFKSYLKYSTTFGSNIKKKKKTEKEVNVAEVGYE